MATLLFSRQRLGVLALLMLDPSLALHVREIARRTGMRAETLHRELRSLADAGILARNEVGNQVRYSADPHCPIHDELIGILRKTAGIPHMLRKALEPLGNKIVVAFVFGSIASGTEGTLSDVDLFVVGHARFAEVVLALRAVSESIKREVNPVVMSTAEFERKVFSKDAFVARLLAGPKVFVVGSEDVLGKLAQDETTATAPAPRGRGRAPARRRRP